jgi:predicted  nucleic acid-binding Zn-ribbon protein
MKYLLLAALLLPFCAQAEEAATCEDYANLAKVVMKHRQYVNDMVETVRLAGDNATAINMAIMAYDRPHFIVAENKDNEAKRFSNLFYQTCLKK